MNIHPGTMNTEMYKIAYEGGLKFPPDNSTYSPSSPLAFSSQGSFTVSLP